MITSEVSRVLGWQMNYAKLSKGRFWNYIEIWEYEVTQYDPKIKSGGLFTEYINNFIKIKTEASGWCVTNEQKEAYVKEFAEREGIQLSLDKIAKNPGLRSLSKHCSRINTSYK